MRDHAAAGEFIDRVAIDAEEFSDLIGGHHVVGRLFRRGCRRWRFAAEYLLHRDHDAFEHLHRDTVHQLAGLRQHEVRRRDRSARCIRVCGFRRTQLTFQLCAAHDANLFSITSMNQQMTNAIASADSGMSLAITSTTSGSSASSDACTAGAIATRR